MQQFLAVLKNAGLDLDAIAIADALWLANQIDLGIPVATLPELPTPVPPPPPLEQRTGERLPPPLPESSPPPPVAEVSVSPPPPLPRSRASAATSGGVPFQAPTAPGLRNSLEIGRSLRPLMRKVPSRTVQVLDEEATAIQIAESAGQRQWVPVFQPDAERWLDLALVVEESRSTVIWQELIAEFQTLLERQGAFRTIRTWSLQTRPAPPAPNVGRRGAGSDTLQLFPRQASSLGEPRPRSAKELLDPAGRQLILVISDCVSPLWRRGTIHPVLKQWANAGPVAIVQLLPERLWNRSALGLGFPVQLSALVPGVASPQLEVAELPAWETVDLSTALTVPVVTLEPESLTQWAAVVAGMGKAQTAGMVFDLALVRSAFGATEVQQAELREQPPQTPENLVQGFRATASPLARRLAGLMSLVPVSLPVIHLIQEAVLPASRQVHVAEIFMSGLVEAVPETESTGEPVQYEFGSGVRELLRASVSKTDALTVLDKVSRYIAERAGLSIKSFAALLSVNTITEIGDTAVGIEVRRFAELSAEALRRMGGEYAALVEEIVGRDRPQIDEIIAHNLLEQQLDYFQWQILDTFIQQENRFELNLHRRELDGEPPYEDIVLAQVEELSVVITERTLTEISEDLVSFELEVRINFAVEISYFDFDEYHPEFNESPTFERTVPNQTVNAVAEANLWFSEEDRSEVEPELVSLRVEQPILVHPARAEMASSVPILPLQELEFEVVTVAFEEDVPTGESGEVHAGAIAWFTDQHIEVRGYAAAGGALASKLNRVALELGEHYEVLSPLLVQIQRSLSRSNSFRYQLADAPETTVSRCVEFGHTLHNEGLLDEFDYDRTAHTLSGVLVDQSEVSQFFSGAWFERYSCQKIVHRLQERGLNYSYLVNPVVGLPNGDRLELDLFFLIEHQPFLIECKAGRAVSVSALRQIARYGESLAIPPGQRGLVVLELTPEQLEAYTERDSAIVGDLATVLAAMQRAVEGATVDGQSEVRPPIYSTSTLQIGMSTDTIALSCFEFEVATLVRQQRWPSQQLSQVTIDEIDNFDEISNIDAIGGDPILNALADEIRATSGQGLSDLSWEILRQAWLGKTYNQIAESLGYTEAYVKEDGAQFFRKLSELIGERVTKTTLRSAVERWFARQERDWVFTVERRLGQTLQFVEALGDGVSLEMVEIPAGRFVMGAPKREKDSGESERPQHEVRLEKFYMGKYAVTQAQWRAVAAMPQVNWELEANPSRFKGDNRPVEQVSWYKAVEFCDRLSKHTGKTYRLPSEAEWEYACRAGTATPFHFGETIIPDLANYDGNYTYGAGPKGLYREETTVVGSFPANAFGLCDMHGNVWEWCQDHWHDNYEGAPTDGSAWVTGDEGSNRILRGGSWLDCPWVCRSAYRYSTSPDYAVYNIGFRVICLAPRTR
jgi:formylglycine-generating enzyme required for sulfatase activity